MADLVICPKLLLSFDMQSKEFHCTIHMYIYITYNKYFLVVYKVCKIGYG